MQTDGRAQSVEAFREAFVGRLQALARAHGLLLDTNWRSADLKTLVEQATVAYRARHPEVIEIEGEPVTITPKQGLGLSLVLHELGTNAVKYGALSQPEGRLRISWICREQPSGPPGPADVAGMGWPSARAAGRERLWHTADRARLRLRVGG
jgi:two-component system CheB/CheR fusion protein